MSHKCPQSFRLFLGKNAVMEYVYLYTHLSPSHQLWPVFVLARKKNLINYY